MTTQKERERKVAALEQALAQRHGPRTDEELAAGIANRIGEYLARGVTLQGLAECGPESDQRVIIAKLLLLVNARCATAEALAAAAREPER